MPCKVDFKNKKNIDFCYFIGLDESSFNDINLYYDNLSYSQSEIYDGHLWFQSKFSGFPMLLTISQILFMKEHFDILNFNKCVKYYVK